MIVGRYQIQRQLGSGGMADVVLAVDLRLRRRVAVKLLASPLADDPESIERFRREAVSAAALNHPNLVAIYDRGSDGQHPFIVMEYVNGETLKSIVAREGGLPEPRVRSNGVDLSSALEAAHAAGIIHRDVKLQNVLVAIDGTLKVTDFGIAASSLAQTQLTQVGSIIGTASYLSPEQALGQPATVRSDVYSAGVCLFEMATGVLPYAGQHAVEIANQHVHAPVPSARHLRRELSDDLDQIIQKAMAKDPNRRYASARSLRTALLRVPAPAPPTSSSASDQPAPTQVTAMTMSQQLGRRATSATRGSPSIAGRSRRGFLAGSALVVAAFLAVGTLLTGGSALDGRGSSAVRHSVPPVWHQPLSKAQSTLRAAGFAPKVTTQDPNSDQARGTVLAQLPKAGTKLAKGATVALTVSTGPLRTPVPAVIGQPVNQAVAILQSRGFTTHLTLSPSTAQPNGSVISTTPGTNDLATRSTTIQVLVSTGPVPVHGNGHKQDHGHDHKGKGNGND